MAYSSDDSAVVRSNYLYVVVSAPLATKDGTLQHLYATPPHLYAGGRAGGTVSRFDLLR